MKASVLISSMLAAAQLGSITPALPPVSSYDGGGMTVAVLDRGFYLEHEIFQLSDESPRITKELSDSLLPESAALEYTELPESLYVNSKIPFAFDYGDGDPDVSQENYDYHGTAMISIAAGNHDLAKTRHPKAVEVAPEAQVLAMKVYSDTIGVVTQTAMCAAIEDSILFGADVILIGITDMCGFENSEATDKINAAIDKAEAAGIIVVTAAGNVMTYGRGNIFERELLIGGTTTDKPDVGTVAWPGSIKSTFCVTSAIGNTLESDCFILPDGNSVPYSDSNTLFEKPTGGKSFAEYFNGLTVEYVITEGLGKPEELSKSGELSGKFAVISRGEITFAEKAKNAADLGALGVIVIDNTTDFKATLSLNAELTEAPIPLIIIPAESGELLKSASSKYITVKSGTTHLTKTRETPYPSDYIAYGTTPELGLKPDIAAVGYNVLCATREGYGYLTSTTAAAARVAGMCMLVKARLTDRFPGTSSDELMLLTKAVLANSAEIMVPTYSLAYSPRIQGAGAVNLSSAMNANILLTSNSNYKIELGDSHERTLNFEINAHNLSSVKKSLKFDSIIGSDDYTNFSVYQLFSESKNKSISEQLGYSADDKVSFVLPFKAFEDVKITVDGESCQLNSLSDDYLPLRLVLKPGTSQTLRLTVTIGEDIYNTYREYFKNGFFIEGYIRAKSGNDIVSIPLLAFSGDFGAAPSLDSDIYSEKVSINEHTYLYRYSSDSSESYLNVLGRTVNGTSVEYDKELIIFSPKASGQRSTVMLNFSLLRSVYDVNITVSGENEIISSKNYRNLPRTYYDYNTEMPISPRLVVWNGRAADNSAYIYPDGDYTVTVSYRPIGSEKHESFSYNLILDSAAPALNSHEFICVGDKSILRLDAADNRLIGNIRVSDSDKYIAELLDNGNWDISELTGKYIYIDITDFAGNSTVTRLENPNYSATAA